MWCLFCLFLLLVVSYQMDIHGRIREVLSEVVRDEQGPAHQSLSEADFLHALQRRGIIDDVMKDLRFPQVNQVLQGQFSD